MFLRKYKKLSSFKRFVLKLLNVYALDRETLNLVNPNYKNSGNNTFKINKESIILSNGYLKLNRKINSLDIFYRFAPNNAMWNSTNRWKRIVPNINKKDLILTSLSSLKKSIIKFISQNQIKVTINLIYDSSEKKFNDSIFKLLDDNLIRINFIETKIEGNRGSYLECCDQAENSEDLIFFIEDDYIFDENCIEEMIITYSRLSTIFGNDVFLCPSDYPFYYDSSYKTSLYIGNKYKWRTVEETLLTFMMSKDLYERYKKNIRLVGEKENDPFEKPLHEIYKNNPCFSPVNSLSFHISRDHPATTEDWIKIWNDNFTKFDS
tara:strand:- start:401 stop:1363 length:963 start_codon:yes stop_codon:yes gene_type:complete